MSVIIFAPAGSYFDQHTTTAASVTGEEVLRGSYLSLHEIREEPRH